MIEDPNGMIQPDSDMSWLVRSKLDAELSSSMVRNELEHREALKRMPKAERDAWRRKDAER